MQPTTHVHQPTGLRVYERGGLTDAASADTTEVACFGYCEHCEIEVPVDAGDLCTYCFNDVADEVNE